MVLPVTVIAGYLGAGKTTLVNALLRAANGRRLAILVNDFGELPIDADLIEGEDGGVVQISGGCVCCSYGGNLARVLDTLLAMEPAPDHVVIEASGVALPGSIAASVALTEGLHCNGTLVLADAEQARRNAANSYLADTITRQLRQADLLVLTKTDLVPEGDLAATTLWLQTIAPRRPVVRADFGRLPLEIALGEIAAKDCTLAPTDLAHARFQSAVLRPKGPIVAKDLAKALADDPAILRAKGFVETDAGIALIHVVGPRHSVTLEAGEHDIGVVCIGPAGQLDLDSLTRKVGRGG